MSIDPDILKRALEREKAARKEAEKILENKSKELFLLTQKLQVANKKLEEGLTAKTSELQGVFHNLVDGYVLMDIAGNVIEMNDAAKKMFGYDNTIDKLNVINLIYKSDYQYAMNSFKELLSKGSFSNYQARIYTKKKEIRTVHINASLIFDKNQKPIAAQGIIQDITEELEQKRIIDEQKKQLSAIVNNSSLGIVLTQFGKILQTNKAFETLLGYTAKELMSMEIKHISVPEEYATSVDFMNKLNSGEINNFSVNKKYKKKDNSLVCAKTNVAAVKDTDGKIKYQVALIEDISEELKQKKLREQLVKDLKKSNDELKDYAHIVSHDLKSPLRSIYALVNWIKEDYEHVLDENGLHHIKLIEETLEKMENLISDILNYSKASNKEGLNNTLTDLNTVVHDILKTIHTPSHITVAVLSKLPTIKIDSTRIQQVFQNLISNAVMYNDKEFGTIEIDYENLDNFHVFKIKDNGEGIKPEYHKKIFKIFQSLGNNKNSTGIGLSIVKKIVDLYDGDIWLESELSIGTTFYFSIKKLINERNP